MPPARQGRGKELVQCDLSRAVVSILPVGPTVKGLYSFSRTSQFLRLGYSWVEAIEGRWPCQALFAPDGRTLFFLAGSRKDRSVVIVALSPARWPPGGH